MKAFFIRFPALVFVCCMGCLTMDQTETICHTLIINARVVDGTGEPAYIGYVAVRADTIYEVGKGSPTHLEACQLIDAEGAVVAPGFIDLHAHGNPDETPSFENFTAMGVTTIVLGQDGGSPGTLRMDSLYQRYQEEGLGTNLIMFYGHGTLREEAGVGMESSPSESQLARMDSILKKALQFTHGLSLGLEYTPGLYAGTDELQRLARVTGTGGGMIMSHMRNEDDDSLQYSIREMISLGEFCPVHISHLKSVYGSGEERAQEILSWIHEAAGQGIDISADVYPYTASYTGIAILFPDWAKTAEQFQSALVNRRQELTDYLYSRVMSRNGPEATLIGTGPFAGMTLAEAARQENKSFTDLLIDDIGPQGASAAYFVMNEPLQSRLLEDSLVGICSDGSPTGYHPRGHGTFARIIEKYVRQEQVLSLEQAVRKMTGFAANILSVEDRGLLKAGMKADLIVFRPRDVEEKATFENPFQLAEGFDFVMVNGTWVRQDAAFTEVLPGRFLLPQTNAQP